MTVIKEFAVCLLLAVFCPLAADAVDTLRVEPADPWLEQSRWRTLDRTDGLLGAVKFVTDNRDGNIWISSELGVQKYDGYHFTTYTHEDCEGLRDVGMISEAADGAMWFSGAGAIVRFAEKDPDPWTVWYATDDSTGISHQRQLVERTDQRQFIVHRRDGSIWAGMLDETDPRGTRSGLTRFVPDEDGGRWERVSVPIRQPRPSIWSLHETSDGTLWACLRFGGLLRYDPTKRTGEDGWTLFRRVGKQRLAWMGWLHETDDGTVWVTGVNPAFVLRFAPGSDQPEVFRGNGLPTSFVTTVFPDSDGAIYAAGMSPGQKEVISRFREVEGWQTYTQADIPALPASVPAGLTMRDGSIWFYSPGGPKVVRFDPSDTGWSTFTGSSKATGLDGKSSGHLWIEEAEFVLRFDGTRWYRYVRGRELMDAPLRSIYVLRKGSALISHGAPGEQPGFDGVTFIDGEACRTFPAREIGIEDLRHISTGPGGSNPLLHGSVEGRGAVATFDGTRWSRTLVPADTGIPSLHSGRFAPDGTVWFGTSPRFLRSSPDFSGHGLMRYDPDGTPAWKQFTTADGLSHNRTYGTSVYDDGTLIVGTFLGVDLLAPGTNRFVTIHHGGQPRSISVVDGVAWWTYSGRGAVYRYAAGQVETRAEFPTAVNLRRFGQRLWAFSRDMIAEYDGERWSRYVRPGLGIIANIRPGPDGAMWYVTREGQVGSFRRDNSPPDVRMLETPDEVSSSGNITLRWSGGDRWGRTPVDQLVYEYRVDDGEWRSTNRQDVTMTALSYGDHNVDVRAIDHEGNVDPTPAVHAFVVEYPWWLNPWMIGLTGVLLAGFGVQTTRVLKRDRRLREANEALSDANNELYRANQEISAQSERKSAFLASMSHELRTPMNAIKGFTNLVMRREDGLSDRAKGNLEKVDQASEHLLAQINDLLDLSKIEAGRMDVSVSEFDVREAIQYCVSTVSPLVREGVGLSATIDDSVGLARTDEQRVRQMVINLLSNAVKFTEDGSVRVRASLEQGEARVQSSGVRESGDANSEYRVASAEFRGEGEILVIAVSDTGKGIPEEEIDTLFDEYRQVVGQSDSDVQRGTGLGLSITKRFAELLGGSIEVESEVGKGSTFTVRIPAEYEHS